MTDEPTDNKDPVLEWPPQHEAFERLFKALRELNQATRWADPNVKAAIARVLTRGSELKGATYLACMTDKRVPEKQARNMAHRVDVCAMEVETMAERIRNGAVRPASRLKPKHTGKPRWYNFTAGRIRDEVEAKWAAKLDWKLEEERRRMGLKF